MCSCAVDVEPAPEPLPRPANPPVVIPVDVGGSEIVLRAGDFILMQEYIRTQRNWIIQAEKNLKECGYVD